MSRLTKILRRLAKVRDRIVRLTQYDDLNISDDLRVNSKRAAGLYKRNLANFREVIRSEEDTIAETDINVKASRSIGDLVLTAVADGEAGNLITIEVLDGATAPNEVIFVEDYHISIGIEDGVTDYAAVKALIEADAQASALVNVAIDGTTTDPAVLTDTVALEGGV